MIFSRALLYGCGPTLLRMRISIKGQHELSMARLSDAGRSYALRMILLGEAGTGKTCLYHRIKYKVSGRSEGRIVSTIGELRLSSV